jgi:hypothetical protein
MVRDAKHEDTPAIAEIHRAMGSDYKFPDISGPLWVVKKVFDADGKVISACALKLTAETYLWLDPSLSPPEKMETMSDLQQSIIEAAWGIGLDDIIARIPEETEAIFKKRLHQLGWGKDRLGWNGWSRPLQDVNPCESTPESS